jgi:hypothetical protein
MAIPHWTWPQREADATTAAALEAATGAFEALSDPTRAAILGALYDADGRLSYSAVADAADVEDNGRLNYHLRELDGLVDRTDAGYALSDRGHRLVDGVRETVDA